MTGHSTTFTAVTLLGRLSAGTADEAAWREFVDRYGPFVLHWCRANGCPASEMEDVLQEVLIKLMRAFPTFRYDPQQSFRGWLATVTRHALSDLLQSRQLRVRGSGDTENLSRLQSLPAQHDLCQQISAGFDLDLFESACALVREQVRPDHWQTFDLTRKGDLTADEAARRLGMKRGTFYVVRLRVVALIRTQVERLQQSIGGGSP